MNRKWILLAWFSTITTIVTLSRGQGFVNLDFEAATIVYSTNGFGAVVSSDALPGWFSYSGTNQLSTIKYNDFIAPGVVGLYGSNSAVISGNFSVYAGGHGSISQTGLVPNGSESLLFDSTSSSILVSLGGVNLTYQTIAMAINSYGQSYSIFGADISGFAGQVETLSFSATGYGSLDNIQFSPQGVPEPATSSLFFLAGGFLIYGHNRNKRRSKPASPD